MRTEAEISADAKDEQPFSNGTEGYAWQDQWCCECTHDDEATELWCPILTVAILGKTPVEWIEQEWGEHGPTLGDTYHCTEFEQRPDDDGPDDDEPEPEGPGPFDPEMPGQVDIFTVFIEQGLTELAEQCAEVIA